MNQTLGFIGMGRMGSHMTTRLLGAGYSVTVFDRTKENAQAIKGARVAETPKELTAACDVVLVSVTDDAAVDQLMFGAGGALDGLRQGSLIIDLSTVSPRTSRLVYEAAREKGGAMIDAAVSGSLPQVDQGSLVIFVGGDRESYDRARSILEVLGQNIFYMGGSGMGTTMKLVVNTLLGNALQSLAEAIALGLKSGLQKDSLLQVLEQTVVLSPSQKSKLANAKSGEYAPLFALSLMHKDFGLVLRQAAEVSVSMPATAAAEQMSAAAMAKGTDDDFSVVIRLMQELAGL